MSTVIYTEVYPGSNPPNTKTTQFKDKNDALKYFYSTVEKFLDDNKQDFDHVKDYTESKFYTRLLSESTTDGSLFLDDPNITPLMKQYFKITKEKDSITFYNGFLKVKYIFKCSF